MPSIVSLNKLIEFVDDRKPISWAKIVYKVSFVEILKELKSNRQDGRKQ